MLSPLFFYISHHQATYSNAIPSLFLPFSLSSNHIPSTMISASKLKSVDFYRNIPRALTEASLSGARLYIVAALSMMFLFGIELSNCSSASATTSANVDIFLQMGFNISFPEVSSEIASVDYSDTLGMFEHDEDNSQVHDGPKIMNHRGVSFRSGWHAINREEEVDYRYGEGSVSLTAHNFDRISHQYPILFVNFFAPWCCWSNRLKPSWEKAAKIIRERYDPEKDGRIHLGKVDCTEEPDLCRSYILIRNHIQGYPSIRIFRNGSDVRVSNGHREHNSYYGARDTDSIVKAVEEALIAPISLESNKHASDKHAENVKRPAPFGRWMHE